MNYIVQMKLECYEQTDELLQFMKEHIGDTDPVMRDELIYPTFCKMIERDITTKEQRIEIYRFLLSEQGLFYNIDKRDDTSVYTRSFSALWLTCLLHHYKANFTHAQFHDLVEATGNYMLNESDRRGYTVHGWAHAIAHGADLISEIVSHPLFSFQHTELMIEAIVSNATSHYAYRDSEIRRLVLAAKAMLLSSPHGRSELLHEIHYKMPLYYEIDKNNHQADTSRMKENARNFIQQLYFQLEDHSDLQQELHRHALRLQ